LEYINGKRYIKGKILDTGSWMLVAGCRILKKGYFLFNRESSIQKDKRKK